MMESFFRLSCRAISIFLSHFSRASSCGS